MALTEFQRTICRLMARQRIESGISYVAGGVEVAREQETAYIDSVRKEFYSALPNMPVPVSEENFKMYGSNSSPTLVLVDRKGIVRLYHPGGMSYDELAAGVRSILGD